MEPFTRSLGFFCILIIIGVFISGCSDNTDQTPAVAATVTTVSGPLYTAGDIVRSASGSESPAWLVVSYDTASDSYTRALIYKNTDGSYGYRTSPATESTTRAIMEKVYTVRITHVEAGSVPTGAPTTATIVSAIAATTAPSASMTKVSTTSTTATLSTDKPAIKDMDPDEGEAGTTVTTEITGSNFNTNATAMLQLEGENSITATTVSYYSAQSITCIFNIPNTTKVGQWDIVVTNSNGLTGEYKGYFTVHGNKSSLT